MTDRQLALDDLRPVAFAIAYRMLGSVDGQITSISSVVNPDS